MLAHVFTKIVHLFDIIGWINYFLFELFFVEMIFNFFFIKSTVQLCNYTTECIQIKKSLNTLVRTRLDKNFFHSLLLSQKKKKKDTTFPNGSVEDKTQPINPMKPQL